MASISFGQISAEQRLISTSGNISTITGGEIISWTIGEVAVFQGSIGSNFYLSAGQQSYPVCFVNGNLNIISSSNVLCQSSLVNLNITGSYGYVQWFLDEHKIVNATTTSYIPVTNGAYRVEAGFTGAFCKSSSLPIIISLPANIQSPIINILSDSLISSTLAPNYEWYIGSRRIVGETNKDLSVRVNGLYRVIANQSSECRLASNSILVSVPGFLDIAKSNAVITDSTIYFLDISSDSFFNIKITPNPASDFFEVEFYSILNPKSEAEFYDLHGHILDKKTFEFDEARGKNYAKFDVNQLPRAVYMLKIIIGNRIKTYKIIKS